MTKTNSNDRDYCPDTMIPRCRIIKQKDGAFKNYFAQTLKFASTLSNVAEVYNPCESNLVRRRKGRTLPFFVLVPIFVFYRSIKNQSDSQGTCCNVQSARDNSMQLNVALILVRMVE